MKNKLCPIIIISLSFVVGVLLYLLDARRITVKEIREQAAQHTNTIAILHGELDSVNTVLAREMEKNEKLQAELDVTVVQHQAEQEAAKNERKKLRSQIVILQTELEPLIEANPKLKLLIEAYEASEAAFTAQITAVEKERDDWKTKFEVSQDDVRALVEAGIKKDEIIKKSLAKYQTCVNDLSKAGDTIAKQKKTIKVLGTTVAVETGSILGYLGLKALNVIR